ncbi:MAG: hypothetical protein OXI35_04255 [Gemmatimonadota bacterium]|nr:hypothetical protein [Gemmatimonadota bacterium]
MLNSRGRIPWILLFSITMSACAQTQFLITGNTYEPWTGPVKILQEVPKGTQYEEIGWVSGKMGGMVSDWGAILKAMQREAGERGANAIILVNKESSTQASLGGSDQYGFYGGSYQEKNLMAIAIRILKAEPAKRMAQTKPIKVQRSNTVRPYSPYTVHRQIARWGLISTMAATFVGSLAMDDAFFSTTVIPIVGPFVTVVRVESDPNAYYHPGGKPLLIASGATQTGFLIYLVASWAGGQSYNAKFSVLPLSHLAGVTMRYRF